MNHTTTSNTPNLIECVGVAIQSSLNNQSLNRVLDLSNLIIEFGCLSGNRKHISQPLTNATNAGETPYLIAGDAAGNHRSADAARSTESHFVRYVNVRNVFVLTKNGQVHH